jgi:phage/plasmid-associated DNA primase
MDYTKYKNRLQSYLTSKGYNNFQKNICCPFHDDKEPSMKVHQDGAQCFGPCGHKDVYDFIGLFENIPNKAEQYKFAESFFGDYVPVIQKSVHEIDDVSYNLIYEYIKEHTKSDLGKKTLINFGKHRGYGKEFYQYFGYWPGLEAARLEFSDDTLKKAGIPLPKKREFKSSWAPAGIVCKFENGFKLMYARKDKKTGIYSTIKRGSNGSKAFPYPAFPNSEQIILVEAEISAIACHNIGLTNTVAIGGTNGLNLKDIDRLLTFEEIIFCFDGDDPGKMACGLLPYDKEKNPNKLNYPEKLIKAGYKGIIKLVELPEDQDPDDLIRDGQIETLQRLIDEATILNKEEEKQPIFDEDNEKLYRTAFYTNSEASIADILLIELKNRDIRIITEPIDRKSNDLIFYIQNPNTCYFEQAITKEEDFRIILEEVFLQYFESLSEPTAESNKLYTRLVKKIQTRAFLGAVMYFLGRKKGVIKNFVDWNSTPECLPCLDCVIDFSGKKMIKRIPKENEYFRDPLNLKYDDIKKAKEPRVFVDMLGKMFPTEGTMETALYCMSLGIANKGQKYFQIWYSKYGNNGKNVLTDLMMNILNGRGVILNPSLVLKSVDKSIKRFGTARLRGASLGVLDESAESEELQISTIKNLTSLSNITIEDKGQRELQIKQTWTLILLSNELPRFFPPDDAAFLNRLICLPFSAVFYGNEEIKADYIRKGVKESNLHKERDKNALMVDLTKENPGILKLLLLYYLKLKNEFNNKIPLSQECKMAKSEYQTDNDMMEQFFKDMFETVNDGLTYITNDKFGELYKDYFGGFIKRGFIKKFKDRYNLEEKIKKVPVGDFSKSARVLVNLKERRGDENNGQLTFND